MIRQGTKAKRSLHWKASSCSPPVMRGDGDKGGFMELDAARKLRDEISNDVNASRTEKILAEILVRVMESHITIDKLSAPAWR
jgi:hypothetical protein